MSLWNRNSPAKFVGEDIERGRAKGEHTEELTGGLPEQRGLGVARLLQVGGEEAVSVPQVSVGSLSGNEAQSSSHGVWPWNVKTKLS